MEHNKNNEVQEKKDTLSPLERHKRTKAIIIACFVAGILLILICASIPGLLGGEGGGGERETLAPVDPDKLCDTKEEDFDIFEYEDYLRYDRTVYLDDPRTGVMISVSESEAGQQGRGFALLYELLSALIAGDCEVYNSLVADSLSVPAFTQQQLYDIVVTKQTESRKESADGSAYDEYVYLVEYKIHENNGSYRNTVEPDACRPQYFVINDSEGVLLVQDIIDIIYKH